MVATKKGPHLEGNFERDARRGGGGSAVVDTRTVPPNPREELGGFIFMCNNDTMDLDRCLFGLPQRYQDLVRAIQPGLPLFLYNYSTRKLHGVYEASSNGALNIEPDAWAAEANDHSRNGRPGSKYPAQVRMRLREERPPLDEESFRPVLRHYEYSKFKLDLTNEEVKLDLSRDEAEALLRLFGLLDDKGGWQTVPTKSNKVNRGHHVPSSPAGIRRRVAPLANGIVTNGTPALMNLNMLATEASARGREREGRGDTGGKWIRRDDSDTCSGSSSVGTVSSWMGHEDDKPKKVYMANGVHADVNGAGTEDKFQDAKFKKVEHPNGNSEVHHSGDVGSSCCAYMPHSNGLGVGSEANSAINHSRSNGRAGFVSYSAALKAGMSPASLEISGGEVQSGYSADGGTVPAVSRSESLQSTSDLTAEFSLVDSLTDKNKVKSLAASRSPKAEPQSMWVAHPKLKVDALQMPSRRGGLEDAGRGPSGLPLADEKLSASEADSKRGDRALPWSKPGALPNSVYPDSAGNGPVGGANESQRQGELIVDEASGSAERGSLLEVGEGEIPHSKFGDKKSAWQGNDAAVLRRLHDSDPAVSSTSLNGSLRSTAEVLKEKDFSAKDLPAQAAESDEPLSGHEASTPKVQQNQHDQNQVPPTSSHNAKIHPQFQHSRPVHEPRRSQFEYPKHDRHVEDRQPHYRKQPLPAELQQHSVPMAHARQNLASMRVPTSPPPPNMHHVLPPPTSSSLYRERRVRAGNGTGDGLQGLTYRPINRNAIEGELGMQSPLANGWAYQSPVVLASPPYTALPGYPPGIYFNQQQLVFSPPHPNVEILHGEVVDFAKSVGPSDDARQRAEAAVECVRTAVKLIWPGADVEVYGSFATGLCISHSDVDVAVVDAPPRSIEFTEGGQELGPAAVLTRELFWALKRHDWCEKVDWINAAIPVVKLRCTPPGKTGDSNGVAIDVTIGTGRKQHPPGGLSPAEKTTINYHNGQAAREWVIERLRQLPALAPLVLLLKSFLHQRSLNDVYSGGLGSFSLTLMLVFYLEWAPIWVPQQETPIARSLCSANASVDTHSASSRDEADEADDDSSISSYCSTNTSASSSSNESTTMSGASATSSRTLDGSGPDVAYGNRSSREVRPLRTSAIAEELLKAMDGVPPPNLGVLLLGFLRWFDSTDFSRVQLVLKGKNGQGGYIPVKDLARARCTLLWIDDPLRPGNNIGAGSFQMYEVQRALKEMLNILSSMPLVPPFHLGERVCMAPGRRRLLDQLFSHGAPSS